MRRAQVTINYIFAAIFVFGGTGDGGTENVAKATDSVYTAEAAVETFFKNPERAN